MTEPLRPGWLADDREWRSQLDALPQHEVEWLTRQWDLAGGPQSDLDLSWLTRESLGDDSIWPLVALWVVGVVEVVVMIGSWVLP